MKGMVLAAGLGERLRPLTNRLPKPLVPVLGRPLVDRAVETLRGAGVDDLVFNLHHLPEKIMEELGDGSSRGVRVSWSPEPRILGPVGGVRRALDFFGGEPFVVWNGDILADLDLREMIEDHLRSGADLTLAVFENSGRPELEAVAFGDGLRVERIWNEPGTPDDAPTRKGINCGVYVYSPSVLNALFPEAGVYDLSRDLWPRFHRRGMTARAFPGVKDWTDIGTPASYLQANVDALHGRWPFPGGAPPRRDGCGKTAIAVGDGALVHPGASFRPPVWIGRRVQIGRGCEIGPDVVVCDGAVLEEDVRAARAVLWPGARAPRGSILENAVLMDGGDPVVLSGRTNENH